MGDGGGHGGPWCRRRRRLGAAAEGRPRGRSRGGARRRQPRDRGAARARSAAGDDLEVRTRQQFSWAISPVPEVHYKSYQAPNSMDRMSASQAVQKKMAAVHAVVGVAPSGTCFQLGSLA